MAKPTKKSAGPFVLWPELTRDDSYQLRTAFNPDKAEYVAHVEDGIDLDTVPLASDTLPDLASHNAVSPATAPTHRRRILGILAGASLTILGVLAAAMVLRNRPSDLPADIKEPAEPSPRAITSGTIQPAATGAAAAVSSVTSAESQGTMTSIHPTPTSAPAKASSATRGETLP